MFKVVLINARRGLGPEKTFINSLKSFFFIFPTEWEKIDSLAEFIKEHKIDIIAATEMEAKSFRSKYKDQAELLSERTALGQNTFFSCMKIKNIINYGNSINSTLSMIDTYNYPLPRAIERRTLGRADIKIDNKTVTILVTHISWGPLARARQIKEVIRIINTIKNPIVLAGDFNNPTMFAINLISEKTRLKSVGIFKTYPAHNPRRCLDHIFISPEIDLIKSYVFSEPLISDHLPVIAELELK
jgi:endonuclease/exonuclease/phosphatase family metal-dependent hydrolase